MSRTKLRDTKAGHKASRFEAFIVLDGERKYQDTLNTRTLKIGEEILLMQEYVVRAREEWTGNFESEESTMDMVRKVGGIALRCMEHHGAVPREEE